MQGLEIADIHLLNAALGWLGLNAPAARQLPALVARILDSPACARFFGGAALRWAGNEVPVAVAGETLRIDRLVALQDPAGTSWWVLDYKLQGAPAADAANREQLQRYVDAVQRLQPGERVRGAFITGAGELVEP